MIQFEGTQALQGALRSLCREFIDIFSTAVQPLPARVKPMVIEVDRAKWELPSNRTQVDALLKLGVIEESRSTHWSQIHQSSNHPANGG